MCLILQRLDVPVLGDAQGTPTLSEQKGREEGKIYGAVSTYRELGLSDSEILERLQKKYHITESEAEAYMQETVS